MKDIINEVINEYIGSKKMLKEYKNPNDSETVRVCADQLEGLYNQILGDGISRHEVTIEKLGSIVMELRKLQQMMSM